MCLLLPVIVVFISDHYIQRSAIMFILSFLCRALRLISRLSSNGAFLSPDGTVFPLCIYVLPPLQPPRRLLFYHAPDVGRCRDDNFSFYVSWIALMVDFGEYLFIFLANKSRVAGICLFYSLVSC